MSHIQAEDRSASSSDKVNEVDHVEHYASVEKSAQDDALAMTPHEEKAMLRKIDLAIVPFSTLLYLLSFLDRINIGQARVYGLTTDLKMTPQEYDIALSLFFVGKSFPKRQARWCS